MNETSSHIDKLAVDLQNIGAPILILLLAAAAGFAIWYYRTTVPPLYGLLGRLLTALRMTALFILVIGLAEPVVSLVRTLTRESGIAVLLDTSSSMDQPRDPSRKTGALEAFDALHRLSGLRCIYRTFDTEIRSQTGTRLSFDGAGTDITGALIRIPEQDDIASIILISDGRWNVGQDPAGSVLPADIPVYCIAVGSDTAAPDIVLSRVSVSAIGYDGTSIPVDLYVASSVPLAEPVRVEIREGKQVAASGSATLSAGGLTKVELRLPLHGPGEHTFHAEVIPVGDEPSDNNRRSFVVRVVKSAFRILVISDAPSADLAFVRRVIESDKAFDALYVFGSDVSDSSGNQFPETVTGFDAVVILDGGGDAVTPQRTHELLDFVSGGGGLWLLGSTPLPEQASALDSVLPVRFAANAGPVNGDSFMELTAAGRSHFITAGVMNMDRTNQWGDLPPLRAVLPVTVAPQTGTILVNAVSAAEGKPVPAVITGKKGSGKIVVMPVSGIWRWELMMEGAGRSGGFFKGFVLGTLRWLTSDTDSSPLIVTTDSKTYLSGEKITFEARLFDNVYSPVSGAEISLVADNDLSKKIILEERTPAVYNGILRGAAPGAHSYRAQAFTGGDLLAETTGSFPVDPFSLEMLDSSPDPELLGQIARKTGGISVTPAGIDSVFSRLQPRIESERREENHYVALSPYLPFLAVLLLAIEWAIRKQRGMI